MLNTKRRSVSHPLNSIIYNRVLLYVFVFISLINMTVYGLMGDITTPLSFVLIGVITAYYNKNMLIILFISLVFSNIFKFGSQLANTGQFKEGMDDQTTAEEEEEEDTNVKTNVKTNVNADTDTDTKSGTPSRKLPAKTKSTPSTSSATTSSSLNSQVPATDEQFKELNDVKDKITTTIMSLQVDIENIKSNLADLQEKVKTKKESFMSR